MILLDLFLTFFKIGLFTVGGGYAMIPVMQREIVDKWQWIQNDLAQITPGPLTHTQIYTTPGFGERNAWDGRSPRSGKANASGLNISAASSPSKYPRI